MTPALARAAHTGDHPAALAAIRAEGCNVAIWRRAPFADFCALTSGSPQDLRFETGLADLPERLRQGLTGSDFQGAVLHETLIADAAILARLFCETLDLARFELRLELVRTDSCRKFHADYVRARLITTYVGEGTDWLNDADADRIADGHEPQHINRLNAFDVGLFKGKLATDRPAIHRSPQIAASDAVRLLMVLNPAQKQFVDPAISAFPRTGEMA